jgi:hypothetical protein
MRKCWGRECRRRYGMRFVRVLIGAGEGKCCPFNALYINEREDIWNGDADLVREGSRQSTPASIKAKGMTHFHGLPPFPPHLLDGLIHLLEVRFFQIFSE